MKKNKRRKKEEGYSLHQHYCARNILSHLKDCLVFIFGLQKFQ